MSQDLEILLAFFVFVEKRPLMVKFSCYESLHGDTDRRCCVQM